MNKNVSRLGLLTLVVLVASGCNPSELDQKLISLCASKTFTAQEQLDFDRLVQAGADVNAQIRPHGTLFGHDVEGDATTCLIEATQAGNLPLIEYAVERAGADPTLMTRASGGFPPDRGGRSAFSALSDHLQDTQSGETDVQRAEDVRQMTDFLTVHSISSLLLRSDGLNSAVTDSGESALELAARYGAEEAVDALLAKGANPDYARAPVAGEGRESYPPLMEASLYGNAKIVQKLLDHSANPSLQLEGGQTALDYAAGQGNAEIVDLLLKHGANPKVQIDEGRTPLHSAACALSPETVGILLATGAFDVNAIQIDRIHFGSQDGQIRAKLTPLIQAISCPTPSAVDSTDDARVQTVRVLLDGGADPNAGFSDGGMSALRIAEYYRDHDHSVEHAQIAKLLVEHGAHE